MTTLARQSPIIATPEASLVDQPRTVFPFHHMDAHSWQPIAGQAMRDYWPEIEAHLLASLAGNRIQLLQMITLDQDMRLTHSRIIAAGTVDHLYARIRHVTEQALMLDAYGVILAHNHTSGDPTPSWDDIAYTSAVHHGFHKLDMALLDHVIVGHHEVFSLRRNGMIF